MSWSVARTSPNALYSYSVDSTAAGSTQHSILFVTWGREASHLIYPKGQVGGLMPEDLGKQLVQDASGNEYVAWVTRWLWNIGLAIADYRYNVRLCNIDADNLDAAGTNSDLVDAMVQAYNRIWDLNVGRTVIYMNRTMLTWVDRQVMQKTNIWFQPMEWFGRRIMGFRGIPIRRCDALLDGTEAVVS